MNCQVHSSLNSKSKFHNSLAKTKKQAYFFSIFSQFNHLPPNSFLCYRSGLRSGENSQLLFKVGINHVNQGPYCGSAYGTMMLAYGKVNGRDGDRRMQVRVMVMVNKMVMA